MKNTVRNFIVGSGILVLLTHTTNAQWVQMDHNHFNGLSNLCLSASGSNLFAGNLSGGVFRCADNDTNWTAVNSGLPNRAVWSLSASGSNLFAGMYQGGGVFRSTDNGASWTEADSGIPVDSSTGPYLIISPAASGGNLFAATEGNSVFLSTNNAASWIKAGSGIPADTSAWPYFIISLVVSGSNIFAAANSGGVYRSSNNGATWTAVNSGLPASNYWYWQLAMSGNNIFAGGKYGVYRSSNNGASWTAANSGLPESTSVMSFVVNGNNIFAGTSQGVFLSTDSGTSWVGCNSGLSIWWGVDGLAVGERFIFASLAAHHSHEIWRRPLSEIVGTINGKPQQGIVKLYAGGFKINITKNGIAVSLPSSDGLVTVGLFTIAGKRIYSATHRAHNGILNIPISGLSTGTYLMSIRGNNTTLSTPFVVTK